MVFVRSSNAHLCHYVALLCWHPPPQVQEPCCLLPLLLGPTTSLVLVGDYKQLGPRVVPAAVALGLNRSLFERLLAAGVAEAHMLDIQYRMHPDIAALPSACFYDGRLKTEYDAQVGSSWLMAQDLPVVGGVTCW
jgi:hypothetical protein